MIFISHRGNLNGVKPELENSPEYIDAAIDEGFDVEIDLRMKDGIPHLGHDEPQYPISWEWLWERREWLWVHVKEFAALDWMQTTHHMWAIRYFCHESDRYTLVSKNWIWSHDLTNPMTKRCVIPLLSKEQVESYNQTGFGAVCSDYIYDCVTKFDKSDIWSRLMS